MGRMLAATAARDRAASRPRSGRAGKRIVRMARPADRKMVAARSVGFGVVLEKRREEHSDFQQGAEGTNPRGRGFDPHRRRSASYDSVYAGEVYIMETKEIMPQAGRPPPDGPWLKRHSELVQLIAAIVQTVVAISMLLSLWQAQAELTLTKQQIASTVLPELDIDAMQQSISNEWVTVITFSNQGAVEVGDVMLVGELEATCSIGSSQAWTHGYTRTNRVVTDVLAEGESATYKYVPTRQVAVSDPGSMNMNGLVFRYRRTADQHSYYHLVTVGREPFDLDEDAYFNPTNQKVVAIAALDDAIRIDARRVMFRHKVWDDD